MFRVSVKAKIKTIVKTIDVKPLYELPSLNETLAEIRPLVREMMEEGPNWTAYQAACFDHLHIFHDSAPKCRIGSNVCCNGIGVTISEGDVRYFTGRVVGRDPRTRPAPVYKSEAGAITRQGTIDRLGRMGGVYGWSVDRDLIAGALASFWHNYVISLIAYFKRPKLPLTEEWHLPNLTLEETREPEQFHPAASFVFRTLPAPVMVFTIRVSCPTAAKLGLDWWDSGKGDIAKTDVEIEAGRSNIIAYVTMPPLLTTGYFTINVLDAPRGITIESIYTTPPSLP